MEKLKFLNQNNLFKVSHFLRGFYSDSVYLIKTPFLFKDGSILECSAIDDFNRNRIDFSDLGSLFSQKFLANGENIDDNYKKEEIEKIINHFEIEKKGGHFVKRVKNDISYDFFYYLQGLICLINLLEI